jgi:hypothetical protein
MQSIPCQIDVASSYSTRIPRMWIRFHRALDLLKREGIGAASWAAANFLSRRIQKLLAIGSRTPSPVHSMLEYGILDLQPGEWVEVKSEEEVLKTVNRDWRTRGLQFVPEMRAYFGHSLRVMKRVERICIENSDGDIGEVRSLKHTVLLEGAMCKGAGVGCDRSCHYFWREAWLKRTDSATHPAR